MFIHSLREAADFALLWLRLSTDVAGGLTEIFSFAKVYDESGKWNQVSFIQVF